MVGKIKQLVFAEGVAVVAPTEVDIVDTVNDQTIAGTKTFDEQIVLKEIATPTTPASGYKAVYPKADGKMYTLDDSGIETEIGSGSGGGGINYIDNSDAEGNVTTGWAVYADAAATTPVDGTGGTANITFTASSSSPLRGTYSFLITKDAANRQGQGASYDFTIAAADKGRPLGIRWEGEASANYTGSSGTEYMVCYVYDVTNATVIATSNVNVAGGSSKGFTTFLATTSTSYRLIFHIAGTGTAAWTYKLDSVSVGPDTVVQGAAVSDYFLITDIATNLGGTGTLATRGRQDGDCLELRLLFASTSDRADAATDVTITLPSRFTIDTDKINGGYLSSRYGGNIGNATLWDSSAGDLLVQQPYAASSTSISFRREDGLATLKLDNIDNADNLQMTVLLPIVGWSSNVTMANRAVEEFASNSSTSTTANDSSSFAYGIAGNQIQSITAALRRSVSFQNSKQATDSVTLELWDGDPLHPWRRAEEISVGGVDIRFKYQNGVSYGVGLSSSALGSEPVTVNFGTYAYNSSTYGAVGTSWAAAGMNTWYWRVRKVSGGAVVGFPVGARNIVGDTSGTTVPSGYIGETITATITAGAVGTSEADITGASLALGAGVWLVCYSLSVYSQTGAVASNATYISACLTDSSNNHVTNSERLQSAKTVAALANYVEGCLASNSVLNLSSAATYKLRARRVDVAGTGSAGVYMTSPTHVSSFFAVRIA